MARGISEKLYKQREKIARAIERGQDPETVCQRFGCSMSLVRVACNEFGVERSTRSLTAKDVCEICYQFLMTERNGKQIADKLQCSYSRVQDVKAMMREVGFVIGRPRGRPRKQS